MRGGATYTTTPPSGARLGGGWVPGVEAATPGALGLGEGRVSRPENPLKTLGLNQAPRLMTVHRTTHQPSHQPSMVMVSPSIAAPRSPPMLTVTAGARSPPRVSRNRSSYAFTSV